MEESSPAHPWLHHSQYLTSFIWGECLHLPSAPSVTRVPQRELTKSKAVCERRAVGNMAQIYPEGDDWGYWGATLVHLLPLWSWPAGPSRDDQTPPLPSSTGMRYSRGGNTYLILMVAELQKKKTMRKLCSGPTNFEGVPACSPLQNGSLLSTTAPGPAWLKDPQHSLEDTGLSVSVCPRSRQNLLPSQFVLLLPLSYRPLRYPPLHRTTNLSSHCTPPTLPTYSSGARCTLGLVVPSALPSETAMRGTPSHTSGHANTKEAALRGKTTHLLPTLRLRPTHPELFPFQLLTWGGRLSPPRLTPPSRVAPLRLPAGAILGVAERGGLGLGSDALWGGVAEGRGRHSELQLLAGVSFRVAKLAGEGWGRDGFATLKMEGCCSSAGGRRFLSEGRVQALDSLSAQFAHSPQSLHAAGAVACVCALSGQVLLLRQRGTT